MSHGDLDEFCLDCHWDTFDDSAAKMPMLPPGVIASEEWHCASSHHAPEGSCDVDDACCVNDNCSMNCSSVCDGIVGCEDSTVCSEAHCDETHCETTGPACCDDNCVGDNHSIDQSIADFLANDATLNWDTAPFLIPSIGEQNQGWQEIQPEPQLKNASVNQPVSDSHTSFTAANSHTSAHSSHHHHHHPCYPYARDNTGLWSPAYSSLTDLSHLDMYDMLGASTGVDAHHNDTLFNQPSDVPKFPCFQGNGAPSCSDAGFQHLGCYIRSTGDTRLQQLSKSQARSRVHRHGPIHASHHRLSHYSRQQSRGSVSSHILPSPMETPPPLDGGVSSALTSPTTGLADDDESHVCRWTHTRDGMKSACGAFFPSAALLQQHMITEHMDPVDGMKGYGYYCRWDGCHRPDEPFSQKSKLQGHFLTHSNYKNFACSVCGKVFARQATLERHERSHRGDKPFKCNECGKSFTDSSELKTHSRTHTGEKPFKCNFPGCKFQTGDSSNMSSHKLTHGVRKHKCTMLGCTKSFTRPDQLKRHLKTTHKVDALPTDLYPPPLPIGGRVSLR